MGASYPKFHISVNSGMQLGEWGVALNSGTSLYLCQIQSRCQHVYLSRVVLLSSVCDKLCCHPLETYHYLQVLSCIEYRVTIYWSEFMIFDAPNLSCWVKICTHHRRRDRGGYDCYLGQDHGLIKEYINGDNRQRTYKMPTLT